jgi:hypothetical protein
MREAPSSNGSNGRDALGRFSPGNRAADGHPRPFARRTAALRRAFVEAVTPEDLRVIAKKLISKARSGDLAAIKLLLLWTLGKPDEPLWPDFMDPPAPRMMRGKSRNSFLHRQPPAPAPRPPWIMTPANGRRCVSSSPSSWRREPRRPPLWTPSRRRPWIDPHPLTPPPGAHFSPSPLVGG